MEFDHKTRKDAFYLYKALWSSEPFVHICGRRFVNRTGDKTLVRVYSNLPGVTLYDGDVVLARQNYTDCSQKGVYLFEVPLTGEMHLRAEAGEGAQAVSDESRGDVAKSTEGNKALQQMLAGMKFESLLLKAGGNVISKEMIRNINETLQKVPKNKDGAK